MIKELKELLEELKRYKENVKNNNISLYKNIDKKICALESAIEVLEKIKGAKL